MSAPPHLKREEIQTQSRGSRRFPEGPVYQHIRDLDIADLAEEQLLPLADACVVFADYHLIQHDFPMLAEPALCQAHPRLKELADGERQMAIHKIIDQWLLDNAAFISTAQQPKSEVNEAVGVRGEPVLAYRPPFYGRANVVSLEQNACARAGDKTPTNLPSGLLDIKGTGLEPGRKPSLEILKSGVLRLDRALLELAVQWLLDEILVHAESPIKTVPTYAVLDAGFNIRIKKSQPYNMPAGLLVRRAHQRRTQHQGWLMPSEQCDQWDFPLYDCFEQDMRFAVETLLRGYGLTSTDALPFTLYNHGDRLALTFGDLRVEEVLSPEEIAQVMSNVGPGRIKTPMETVTVQFTRVDEDRREESSLQLLDFGSYRIACDFHMPMTAPARDRPMTIGPIIWPDDPRYVRVDPQKGVKAHAFWDFYLAHNPLTGYVADWQRGAMSRDAIYQKIREKIRETLPWKH